MRIINQRSPYYGWYDIVVPAGRHTYKNGILMPPEMQPEMKEWLLENVGQVDRDTWVSMMDRDGRHILFKRKDKAMMFKLTWV